MDVRQGDAGYVQNACREYNNLRPFIPDFCVINEVNMEMKNIPFEVTDWSKVTPTEHQGETGTALWRTRQCDQIRVRMVTYSAGYLADHWCAKGHILLCLEGELHTELADGRKFILMPGMSYQVADDTAPHRSYTPNGVKIFIVD